MIINDNLQRWWRSRTPEQKRYYKMGSVLGTVVVVVAVSVVLTGGNHAQNAALQQAKNSHTFLKNNLKDMSGNSRRAQVAKMNAEIQDLSKVVAAQNNISTTQLRNEERNLSAKVLANLHKHPIELMGNGQESPQVVSQMKDLQAQLAETQAEMRAMAAEKAQAAETPAAVAPSNTEAAGIVISDGLPTPVSATQSGMPETGTSPTGITPPSAPSRLVQLRVHPSARKLVANTVKVSSKNSIYLPASTVLTGVTINGIDARTGPGAHGAPEIVDIRVKKNAILPNGYRSNIENCEILASGYGSLESHRVYLRTNELSCVSRNGGVISAPVKGYIVGTDGIVGIKGTVISHQSSKLMKSFLAGLLSGIGGAGRPSTVGAMGINPNMGSMQSFQLPNPAMMGYSAASGGISTASGQLAQYYLREAEALQPVIQVNPGVSVTIILQYGTQIRLNGNTKRQIDKTNYAVSQETNQSMSPGQSPGQAPGNGYGGMVQGAMPPLQQNGGYPAYGQAPVAPPAYGQAPYGQAPAAPYGSAYPAQTNPGYQR
ncbi:hypothetical protein JKG47_03675 [Acidithiobacillus sp. MC6.1]|nr:hypothetical protein [Acidithiobacillus sp. MC6.1]